MVPPTSRGFEHFDLFYTACIIKQPVSFIHYSYKKRLFSSIIIHPSLIKEFENKTFNQLLITTTQSPLMITYYGPLMPSLNVTTGAKMDLDVSVSGSVDRTGTGDVSVDGTGDRTGAEGIKLGGTKLSHTRKYKAFNKKHLQSKKQTKSNKKHMRTRKRMQTRKQAKSKKHARAKKHLKSKKHARAKKHLKSKKASNNLLLSETSNT